MSLNSAAYIVSFSRSRVRSSVADVLRAPLRLLEVVRTLFLQFPEIHLSALPRISVMTVHSVISTS